MVESLPGLLNSIVAADATAAYRRVIHKGDDGLVCGDVTIGALARSHYMIRRLRGCPDKSALGMTTGAAGIGWPERAADVTTFASYVDMRPIKSESGTEMIELLFLGVRRSLE